MYCRCNYDGAKNEKGQIALQNISRLQLALF